VQPWRGGYGAVKARGWQRWRAASARARSGGGGGVSATPPARPLGPEKG